MLFKSENPAKMFLFKGSVVTFNHGQIETEDKDMITLLSGLDGVEQVDEQVDEATDEELLAAREEYESIFDKKPASNMLLATMLKKIAESKPEE